MGAGARPPLPPARPGGVGGPPAPQPRGATLLDAAGRQGLRAALAGDAADGGPWDGPKVAAWIAAGLGRRVVERSGWVWLRRVGYTPQVLWPAHAAAGPEEHARFPKA